MPEYCEHVPPGAFHHTIRAANYIGGNGKLFAKPKRFDYLRAVIGWNIARLRDAIEPPGWVGAMQTPKAHQEHWLREHRPSRVLRSRRAS